MSNEYDPWGDPPKKRNDDKQAGPPDLDQILQNLAKKFFGKTKSGGLGNDSESQPPRGQTPVGRLLAVAVAIAAFIWVGFSFYVIDEQERGIVLRLGQYHSTLTPGLQWQPYFIDNVITINVTSVRDRVFDNTMLTSDENIVDVQLQVQYIVTDPQLFVLNIREPEKVLVLATDSALRSVVGSTKLDDVITTGRQLVADRVKVKLQNHLDVYQSGLGVRKVNVSAAKAPDEVKPAFDDVIKAREDKVRHVNEATAYENSIVPEARGRAQRMIEDARGYKESVIARAQGDAQRFLQLLAEYRKAPQVTKTRLYLQTMEKVLASSSKVLLDIPKSNSLMYLPVDQILKSRSDESIPELIESGKLRQSDLESLSSRVVEQLRNNERNISSSIRREGR